MVPDLVQSTRISDDKKTYIFTLKPHVRWHDGAPFSADDVVFTFNTLIDPTTNTVRRGHFLLNGQPIRFEAIDSLTVKATLPEPYAPFLSVLDMGILPKHRLVGEAINTTDFNRHPIGTGPFKFVEWQPHQFVRLTRNDDYFSTPPKLNGMIMRIIPDPATALLALKKGEIDATGIPPKDIEKIRAIDSLNTVTYQRLNYSYIGFNLRRPPFNDRRIRQGINYAIQPSAIINHVLHGNGEPAYIPSHPLSWAHPDDGSFERYDYDPDAARAQFEASGYRYNTDRALYEKNGQPLQFTLYIGQGSQDMQRIAQIIQQFLSAVGVRMTIQSLEWSQLLSVIHSKQQPKPFDAVLLGWGFDINDPDDAYTSWHSSQYPNGGNFNGYANQHADALLEQGRVILDPARRRDIYAQFYATVAQDAPYVFLFHATSTVGVQTYVRGTTPGPQGILHNIESISIDLDHESTP